MPGAQRAGGAARRRREPRRRRRAGGPRPRLRRGLPPRHPPGVRCERAPLRSAAIAAASRLRARRPGGAAPAAFRRAGAASIMADDARERVEGAVADADRTSSARRRPASARRSSSTNSSSSAFRASRSSRRASSSSSRSWSRRRTQVHARPADHGHAGQAAARSTGPRPASADPPSVISSDLHRRPRRAGALHLGDRGSSSRPGPGCAGTRGKPATFSVIDLDASAITRIWAMRGGSSMRIVWRSSSWSGTCQRKLALHAGRGSRCRGARRRCPCTSSKRISSPMPVALVEGLVVRAGART